ncbi:MAG TPA: hypothetical protein VKF60_01945 [Myxococcota bacterium]|nr:hypothetical protein [Myxococcota bacterium]
MGRVKGITILDAVKFLRARRDDAAEVLPVSMHAYLDDQIVASIWYPEADFVELIRAVAKLLPGPIDRALMMMGERGARAQTVVYGDLIRGIAAHSRTFALWSSQHDTGEMRSTMEGRNRVRVELVGYEDTSREFCLLLGGYVAGTLAVNGITDSSVQKLSCRLWGDRLCAWRGTWTPLDEK